MPLAAGRRRTKPEARPRGQQPPTHEPQVCRTCRLELAASHFSVKSDNRSGRKRQCRACCANEEARRLAAWAPPDMPQTKECLHCQQELPATAFYQSLSCSTGLHSHCRKCNAKRVMGQKERLPSQLPMPMSIVCAACHEAKPLSEFAQRRGTTFGVQGVCSKCTSARMKLQRQHAAKLRQAAAPAGSDSHGNGEGTGGGEAAGEAYAAGRQPRHGGSGGASGRRRQRTAAGWQQP